MKPIRWKPKPVAASIHEYLDTKCDRCGEPVGEDMRAGFRYEDTDMGDYIERREVETLCSKCMDGVEVRSRELS